MKCYKPVKSDKQVGTIRRCTNAHDYYRLAELVASFVRKQHFKNHLSITDKFLHQYKGDHNLYSRIRDLKIPSKKEAYAPAKDRSYVSQNYANFLREAAPDKHFESYLDFGCGTGTKSMTIAEQLDIGEVHGIDIHNWSVLSDETPRAVPNMHYINAGDALPFEDEQFSLISAFSVLHHVGNISFIAEELARCLKPGGYLIIREHNVEDSIDQMIVEIEHRIFDYIKIPDFDKNTTPDYINCRTAEAWHKLFTDAGLQLVVSETDWYHKHTQDPTKLFHAIYVKT